VIGARRKHLAIKDGKSRYWGSDAIIRELSLDD